MVRNFKGDKNYLIRSIKDKGRGPVHQVSLSRIYFGQSFNLLFNIAAVEGYFLIIAIFYFANMFRKLIYSNTFFYHLDTVISINLILPSFKIVDVFEVFVVI